MKGSARFYFAEWLGGLAICILLAFGLSGIIVATANHDGYTMDYWPVYWWSLLGLVIILTLGEASMYFNDPSTNRKR